MKPFLLRQQGHLVRIARHALCMLRHGHVAWHWQGIVREFR